MLITMFSNCCGRLPENELRAKNEPRSLKTAENGADKHS